MMQALENLFSILASCGNSKTLKKIHAQIITTGMLNEIVLATKLVNMYSSFGFLNDSRRLFEEIDQKNIHVYNAIIRGHSRAGFWHETLMFYQQLGYQDNVSPDRFTFPFALKVCAKQNLIRQGREVHGHAIRFGFLDDVAVAVGLIDMYSKCGRLAEACQLFDGMTVVDTAAWNAMISSHLRNGRSDAALQVFRQMQKSGFLPNPVTIVTVLPVCGVLGYLSQGQEVHEYLIRSGIEMDNSVASSVVSMYARCGYMDFARKVFAKMSDKGIALWNSMISGYSQNELFSGALGMVDEMINVGVDPDLVTLLSVLPSVGNITQAQRLHSYVFRRVFVSSVAILNSFVAVYARCGDVEDSKRVFDRITRKDVVSWTAVIAGYVQNEKYHEALQLFSSMELTKFLPDSVTLVSAISACGHLESLQQGQQIHCWISTNGFGSDLPVMNALISMYSRLGWIEMSQRIFYKMPQKNLSSWNALIAGLVHVELYSAALVLFQHLQKWDHKPDNVNLSAVLSACGSLHALKNGQGIHGFSVKYGYDLDLSVGTALIDTYGKCGDLGTARKIFDSMTDKDAISWSAMIGAYGIHGYGKEALELFSLMQESAKVGPNHATFVSVLTACSHGGLIHEGWFYFNFMTEKYGIQPNFKHYTCMVNLLGRAGLIEHALNLVRKMPGTPDVSVWDALLGACKINGNTEMGQYVVSKISQLVSKNSGSNVSVSNSSAAFGSWSDVENMRYVMRRKLLQTGPTPSMIEMNNKPHDGFKFGM